MHIFCGGENLKVITDILNYVALHYILMKMKESKFTE